MTALALATPPQPTGPKPGGGSPWPHGPGPSQPGGPTGPGRASALAPDSGTGPGDGPAGPGPTGPAGPRPGGPPPPPIPPPPPPPPGRLIAYRRRILLTAAAAVAIIGLASVVSGLYPYAWLDATTGPLAAGGLAGALAIGSLLTTVSRSADRPPPRGNRDTATPMPVAVSPGPAAVYEGWTAAGPAGSAR